MIKQLAELIMESQKIREESFNQEKAEIKATTEKYVNYNDFYEISLEDACKKAVINSDTHNDNTIIFPIYLLNKHAWNDIQAWAESVITNE